MQSLSLVMSGGHVSNFDIVDLEISPGYQRLKVSGCNFSAARRAAAESVALRRPEAGRV